MSSEPDRDHDLSTAHELGRLSEAVKGLTEQLERVDSKLDYQYGANKKRIMDSERRLNDLEKRWQRQQGVVAVLSIIFSGVAAKVTGLWSLISSGGPS